MTATALACKRALDTLRTRHGEEAALWTGLLPRDWALLLGRDDAALALVPGPGPGMCGPGELPGGFVGMLLGGATPLHAAAVQLVVLVALPLGQAAAVLVTVELVARGSLIARGLPTTSWCD
jgi:putative ABC transport system permease protein